MAGLTSTGFETKDLDTILTELENNEKSRLGADLNVRATSVVGVFNGVMSDQFAEIWEVMNEVYASQYPDTATGVSLDQLCALTGVRRLAATQSTATVTITGTPATVIPAGRRIKHATNNSYWTTDEEVTIGGGGTVSAAVTAEEYGPTQALAGTLTVIDTPVSGWTSVTNALDADEGRDVETDSELRARREELLTAQGKGTLDSIYADILALDDVESVVVFENYTNATDADGLPSKSFEVVVLGGTAADIGQAIWDAKPAGISAYGASAASATDSMGVTRIVGYTRPTEKNIYASITAATGTGYLGATATLAAAVVAVGDAFGIGGDVIRSQLFAPCFIAGVTDVSGLTIGLSASPVGTANISIGSREISAWDTSRIVVWIV
jgi:uncharacterized phage protein gp47/JayE